MGIFITVVILFSMAVYEGRRTKSNYYEVLGVPRNASKPEITRAYRKLSLLHHPDKCTENCDPAVYLEMQAAYESLSEENARHRYELFGPGTKAEGYSWFSSVIGYAVRLVLGLLMTLGDDVALARTWVAAFLLFSAAAEILTRSLGEPSLLAWAPIVGNWTVHEQLGLFESIYPVLLNGGLLLARSIHSDSFSICTRGIAATERSNRDFAAWLRARGGMTEDEGGLKKAIVNRKKKERIEGADDTPTLATEENDDEETIPEEENGSFSKSPRKGQTGNEKIPGFGPILSNLGVSAKGPVSGYEIMGGKKPVLAVEAPLTGFVRSGIAGKFMEWLFFATLAKQIGFYFYGIYQGE